MVLAAAPSRSVDQAICDLADSMDQLVQLLMQLQSSRLTVFTEPSPSEQFHITVVAVGTTPQRVLARNPLRQALTLQWLNPSTVYIGSLTFDPNQTNALPNTGISFDGHAGEVWAAAVVGTVNVTVIEQFRGPAG